MGGKTSAKSKNKWIAANYDRIGIVIPRGEKDIYKATSEQSGLSLNAWIVEAMEEKRAKNTK